MDDINKTDIRNVVRESYGKIADGKVNDEGCCGGSIKIKNSVKEIFSEKLINILPGNLLII